jgi:hypothetical protein
MNESPFRCIFVLQYISDNHTLISYMMSTALVSADRGHGLGVSMEVYTASDRQQKREAVKKLESAVALKRKPKLPEKA